MFIPNNLLDASTVALSDRDRDAIAEILQSLRRESIIDPSPTTRAVALRAAACLPLQAVRAITNLRRGVDSDLGIVVLRNTPLDRDIPRQPKPTRLWYDKRSSVSEGVHLAVHAAMGTVPFSYRAENDGATVATLSPKPGDEAKQESTSSDTLLELHGENQAHRFPPDLLVISNLQEDGHTAVGTIIASNRLAGLKLSASEVDTGCKPIFVIDPPSSFRDVNLNGTERLIPMFRGSPDDLMLNFDAHAMRSIEPEGERLIETMKRVLQEVAVTVCLRRGDLILIDNRIVAHGRVGFRADYDHPRITQRSFGCFDFAVTWPARRRGSTILDWIA